MFVRFNGRCEILCRRHGPAMCGSPAPRSHRHQAVLSPAALTWCSAAADYGRPLQHRVRPNSTRVRALDSFIVL